MNILNRERSRGEDLEENILKHTAGNASISSFGSQSSKPHDESKVVGLSIEQSVKAFKIFELLRSGSTDSISKAIQESDNLQGTSILHLAIQCADPVVVEQVLRNGSNIDINAQDKDGNTALHLASMLGRVALVQVLLDHKADATIINYQSKSALDLARTPEIFQLLQLDRAMFTEYQIGKIHQLVSRRDYDGLEELLEDPRITSIVDVNAMELASDSNTVESGGTLLHEAARNKDHKLIQLLLLNGADPFRRDKKGRLPKDVTKDDRTKAILKKSPAATAAQRGIQEKAILGGSTGDRTMGRESREIKGYLKKWTNYTTGYKLRWFVLEDGVLSYYKHQDDAGSACRGAMNMKIAKLSMDPQDKTRFEIVGKSSVKYHLKANHEVEAKRWFWALNNSIQWAKDEARQEEQRAIKEADAARQAISEQRSRESAEHRKSERLTSSGLVAATVPNLSKPGHPPSSVGSVIESQVSVKNQDIAIPGDVEDDEEYGDDASSHELRPTQKDAFAITAHSAGLQLDILSQVSLAMQYKITSEPETPIGESSIQQAISTYSSAVQSLQSMIGDLQKISKDRDAYWQYRLDRETDMRRMWEESMAKVVKDQEELEGRIGLTEERRRRTKRALREALDVDNRPENTATQTEVEPVRRGSGSNILRRPTITTIADLSESESDLDEEEFFDAVGAGEVPISPMPILSPKESEKEIIKDNKLASSFIGYEDGIRKRLKMDADDRPKISLWVC
jgi:oxysterol-binding protein 1